MVIIIAVCIFRLASIYPRQLKKEHWKSETVFVTDWILSGITYRSCILYAGADQGFPIGGAPTLIGGGANLRHRHFSVKTYVKTKEFGPFGGGGAHAGNFCM